MYLHIFCDMTDNYNALHIQIARNLEIIKWLINQPFKSTLSTQILKINDEYAVCNE